MSGRNFTRRFSEAVGTTPARWILTQRLEEVRRLLLGTTTWSIERIARACGFGSAGTLRQNFTATYATTPTSYRQRFSVSDGARGPPGNRPGPRAWRDTEGGDAVSEERHATYAHGCDRGAMNSWPRRSLTDARTRFSAERCSGHRIPQRHAACRRALRRRTQACPARCGLACRVRSC